MTRVCLKSNSELIGKIVRDANQPGEVVVVWDGEDNTPHIIGRESIEPYCEVCGNTGEYPIYDRKGGYQYDITCPECFGPGVKK
jgi:hypothetical protein